MFRGSDILCIGPVAWDGMWARAQQVMTKLAEDGHRVIYVNPPITWLSPVKDPSLWRRRVLGRRGLEQAAPQIWVLHTQIQLPFGNMKRWINLCNQQKMARQIKNALRDRGFQSPYLWTYLPSSADLIPKLPGLAGVIYDCVDEHSSFNGLIDPGSIRAMEQDLIKGALVTFVTAKELLNRRQGLSKHIYWVPNAAKVEDFLPQSDADVKDHAMSKQPLAKEAAKAPELEKLTGPIIGFYGGIGDWIDLELIAEAAQSYPQYNFVLIGSRERDFAPIHGLENISYLGPKPYSELPGLVKDFDLCLMPFKVNDLTMNVNPVKMYEHLAAGKAVLSTDLPEVRPFADVVAIARSRKEFVEAIPRLLLEEKAAIEKGSWRELLDRRVQRAKENSWSCRLAEMTQLIEKVLAEQGLRHRPN